MGSYGVFNPQLDHMPDNGTKTALQSRAPSIDTCSFNVTIRDVEAPMCATNDTMRYELTDLPLGGSTCNEYIVNVVDNFTVKGVRITELRASVADVGLTSAYLESPQGTKVQLWNNLCSGQSDIWIIFDDESMNPVSGVSCNPMGNGLDYKPQEAFKKFIGEDAQGDWKLRILSTGSSVTDMLDVFRLELLSSMAYAQGDTTISNDTLRCDAEFTWIHPVFMDNCCEGSMRVEYIFSNVVTGGSSTTMEIILSPTIDLDGTLATRIFKVGTTIVRYTLVDIYGNESTCEFRVIVEDSERPIFVAGCEDRVIQLDPRECDHSLQPLPTVDDNCAIDTILYFVGTTPLDITNIPIGVTEITAVVCDIYGNKDTCTFSVTVNEFIPTDTQLSCIGKVNISLDGNCEHTLTAGNLLIGDSLRCLENYCIEVKDANGNIRSNTFTQADIGKTFYVSIIDCNGSGNRCWGEVLIEDKLVAQIECPRDTQIWCNIDPLARFVSGPNTGKLRTGEVILLNCEPNARISFIDDLIINEECGIPRARINRKWTVRDARGNTVTCTQVIDILRFENQAITWPQDITGVRALNCGAVSTNPDVLLPDATGKPLIEGEAAFGDNYCDINIGFSDRRLNDVNCANAYIIFRTWEVFNRCAPYEEGVNPRRHTQTIRVEDKTPPVIPHIADVTISVNAWACEGQYKLPNLNITDNCGNTTLKWRMPYGYVENGTVYGLQKGQTVITVVATDNCKNQSTRSFTITVVDRVAPVASAKEYITVSLTKSGDTDISGVAKIFAHQIDNGSYDNCTGIKLEIRRDDEAPACLNLGDQYDHDNNPNTPSIPWNNNRTYNNDGHLQDNVNDTDGGEYVKFCCEDRGKDIKVWLRVWDDASGDGIYGNEGDNYNETWAIAHVEDKIVPKFTCKPDVAIDCDRDSGSITEYNFQTASGPFTSVIGKVPASLLPTVEGICSEYDLEFRDAGSLSTCNTGTFTRTYRVKGFPSVTCTQIITVRGTTQAVLEHPISLHVWDKCTLTEDDVYANTVRLSPSLRADVYGGCSKYDLNTPATNNSMTAAQREAATTNGFTPNDGALGASLRNQARFNSNYKNSGCAVFGKKLTIEEYNVGDGCKKWLVKWDYINWCDNSSAGCRETIYKFEDTTAPVITNCPGADLDIADASCEVAVTLRPSATDALCDDEQTLTWRVRIYEGTNIGINPTNPAIREILNVSGSNPSINFQWHRSKSTT
jgi:hypothetical protein